MHKQPSHSEERGRERDGCWQALVDHRRFSVEAARLPRRERGLREQHFITFRDQCVFLWQQAEGGLSIPARCNYPPHKRPTAVAMEAEHTEGDEGQQ